jgi:RNA polymerase sigma-70 factor (ECF subfamily)
MSWDSRTFESCFRERYPELVQFLHGLTGDRATAEDVAQEAFARLWARGPRVRPRADYWLFKAARNLALDWLKTDERRNQRERAERVVVDAPGFTDVEVERVRALVHELPARDREVLLLREFSELSYAEIAEVVGRSLDSVKQDLFRARERLRQQWNERYGGER